MTIRPDLANDMRHSLEIVQHLKDVEIARDFYRALCNVEWFKDVNLSEDIKIINRLKDNDVPASTYSWRASGGLIAEIRSDHYGTNEDYMDFYCSGDEAYVSPLVKECFKKLGWRPGPHFTERR